MKIHRRELLGMGVGAALAGASKLLAEPAARRSGLGIVIHSYGIRRANKPAPDAPDFADPANFLEHCAALGAAGVQTAIGVREKGYLAKLREQAEKCRMYLEGIVALPRNAGQVGRFEEELRCSREAGAVILRTVTLSTRRYETFDSAEAFQAFAKQAWESLRLAEPVAARQGVRLAVENHKDWRADELLGILKRLDSRHIGVCLDTGNSIALLEDPHEVVRAYAPWTFTTHFKDMGVCEHETGFLLSEMPLGLGFLDLKQMLAILKKANPEIRINLEMITRDPLLVPCLTKKYWATFETLPGRYLAATLSMVRAKALKQLPVLGKRSLAERLEMEEDNVRKSLHYSVEHLSL
jgi:sugar phosphate isomerase/epimerase